MDRVRIRRVGTLGSLRDTNRRDARIPISVGGGEDPAWPTNGDEIFFVNKNSGYSVDVSQGLSTALGKPRALFPVHPYRSGVIDGRTHDVGPKGEFAMVRTRSGSQLPQLETVLGGVKVVTH